jgi:hypothetical protein
VIRGVSSVVDYPTAKRFVLRHRAGKVLGPRTIAFCFVCVGHPCCCHVCWKIWRRLISYCGLLLGADSQCIGDDELAMIGVRAWLWW